MLGVACEAPSLATGYGAYLAQPLLREILEKQPVLSQTEARELVERCMRVLYYRDARSYNRVRRGSVIGPAPMAEWLSSCAALQRPRVSLVQILGADMAPLIKPC
uniref:Proteasome subunit beta type-4 n=1 Tax=Equus asinus TaxID=9793 RepID=A0A9L0IEY9_EQUAS